MSDDELTARERINAVRKAEEAEAFADTIKPGFARWIVLEMAKLMRWCASDHREHDRDIY